MLRTIQSDPRVYLVTAVFGNHYVCHCQGDFSLWRGSQKIVNQIPMKTSSKVVLFKNTLVIFNSDNIIGFPRAETDMMGNKLDYKEFRSVTSGEVKLADDAVIRVYKDRIGVEQTNSFELLNWDPWDYRFDTVSNVNYYKWRTPAKMLKNGVLTTYC